MEVDFDEVTYTINGTLTLDGALGEEITLNSIDDTNRFTFDVTNADQTVDYVNIKNSNSSTNDIIASNSVNNGNTDHGEGSPCWVIGNGNVYVWTDVAANGTWADANNWTLNGIISGFPDDPSDYAFIGESARTIILASGATIGSLQLDGDFSGILEITGLNTFTIDDSGTLDGDVIINEGILTHADNTTEPATNKLIMDVDGDSHGLRKVAGRRK